MDACTRKEVSSSDKQRHDEMNIRLTHYFYSVFIAIKQSKRVKIKWENESLDRVKKRESGDWKMRLNKEIL